MRLLVVVVVSIVCAGGRAVAQPASPSPPSKTLERAVKLYEKKDFYSASIELKKVVDGESGDAKDQVDRAWFFLGRTLYQMEYPAAALAVIDRIAQDPAHAYHAASLKWMVQVLDQLPDVGHGSIGAYDPAIGDAADPATREGFRFHLGRLFVRQNKVQGVELLKRIPNTSQYRSRAALLIAQYLFGRQGAKEAIAELLVAARDPAVADDAVRTLVVWSRLLRVSAVEALTKMAETTPLAKLERSRIEADAKAGGILGLVTTPAFEAIAIAARCTDKPFTETVGTAAARVEEMLERDDNAEAFDHVKKKRRDPIYATLVAADAPTREAFAWTESLAAQIARHKQADRAWATTMIAAEILQELTVQISVGEADAGKHVRAQVQQLAEGLLKLRELGDSPEIKLVVTPAELCSSILGMPARIAEQPAPQPIPVAPTKANGCAGCASSDGGGGAFALLLGLAALRRRRR